MNPLLAPKKFLKADGVWCRVNDIFAFGNQLRLRGGRDGKPSKRKRSKEQGDLTASKTKLERKDARNKNPTLEEVLSLSADKLKRKRTASFSFPSPVGVYEQPLQMDPNWNRTAVDPMQTLPSQPILGLEAPHQKPSSRNHATKQKKTNFPSLSSNLPWSTAAAVAAASIVLPWTRRGIIKFASVSTRRARAAQLHAITAMHLAAQRVPSALAGTGSAASAIGKRAAAAARQALIALSRRPIRAAAAAAAAVNVLSRKLIHFASVTISRASYASRRLGAASGRAATAWLCSCAYPLVCIFRHAAAAASCSSAAAATWGLQKRFGETIAPLLRYVSSIFRRRRRRQGCSPSVMAVPAPQPAPQTAPPTAVMALLLLDNLALLATNMAGAVAIVLRLLGCPSPISRPIAAAPLPSPPPAALAKGRRG